MYENTRLPNQLGIIGWLRSGRRGVEGYVYLLHRLSGIVLLLFLIAHVVLTSSRLLGMDVWVQMMTFATSPVVQLFKYPVFVAFAFHACNGVRLILLELGIGVGRAEHQVYPYHGSVRKQRPLLIAMMALSAMLLVVGEFDVLRLAH